MTCDLLFETEENVYGISCHYLPVSGLGNLRVLPSLDVVSVSQAPSSRRAAAAVSEKMDVAGG